MVENIAIERAKKLFNCTYANVQPHSGAHANMAVELALLQPGDTMMGMKLAHGGHLTHGSPVNFSGHLFNIVGYGVTEEGYIRLRRGGAAGHGAQAQAHRLRRQRLSPDHRLQAFPGDRRQVRRLSDVGYRPHCRSGGGGSLHPSPFPWVDVATTTTHKTLKGPRGGMILSSAEFAAEHKLNKWVFPGIRAAP